MTILICSYKAGGTEAVELRYALRSIEQNLHGNGGLRLILVGDPAPEWLRPDDNLVGNPYADDPNGNVAYNVKRACELIVSEDPAYWDGGEQILYMDDDYFLMDPTSDVLQVNAGRLSQHVAKCRRDLRKGHWFTERLENTYRQLERMTDSEPLVSMEIHRPMVIFPRPFLSAMEEMPSGVMWRSWYGNVTGHTGVFARDGRYVGRSFPIGVPWVSSEDRAWAEWMGRKIAVMFPTPSRWEK